MGGDFCLGKGPAKDVQSGQPSATLVDCASAVPFEVVGNQLVAEGNFCLDITANGKIPSEPVEWYPCQGKPKNELWDFVETPAHTQQVVSHMDGKCLSACPSTSRVREFFA